MSEILNIAARIQAFLCRHNINPDKVRLVIRADDDITADRIKDAVEKDVRSLLIPFLDAVPDPNGGSLKASGIKISVSSLDKSATL